MKKAEQEKLIIALKEARAYIAGGTPTYDFVRVISLCDEALKSK